LTDLPAEWSRQHRMLGQSPKKLVSGSGKRNFAGRDKRAGMAPKTNFAFEGDKSRARNAAISGHSATNGEISVRARLYGRAGRLELLTKRLRTARADHLSCLHMRFGISDSRYFSTSDVLLPGLRVYLTRPWLRLRAFAYWNNVANWERAATLFERTSAIRADPTAVVPPADVHLHAFGL
jgi:hypothetical protein